VDKHQRRLVSINQAAEYCGVVPRTIRRRIADGSLTGYRLGTRLVRVDQRDLDRLLRPIPTAGGDAA
jgi:excisionase family DNA binding protein